MSYVLAVTYRHRCPPACTRQGAMITERPYCRDGAAFVVAPICIETGAQLEEVKRVSS